ncbi:uncharacterized protein LOC108263005 [Ictalurus punctatus]|uniref:Uncharacterized protein LOC108263005 n=1 Tax=Ictalurus punctatus TaxID=7998 RepID=A0A2D0QKH7_ICTPU|nr:uncharacterized protein LOC108263005 [Ictalurus punctatus]
MPKLKTLNELKQLEESGFGKPFPRHGLKLLYWFAHDCLYFDDNSEMCWQYDPEEGDFAFHLFENRIEKNGDKLLPDVNLDYYVVGNLSKAGADELPDYVREDFIKNCNNKTRNMDRIIVSVEDEYFDRVYVTEHSDRTDFNKEATYRISRGLIMIIRRLILEEFLLRTGYSKQQTNIFFTIPVTVPIYLSNQEPLCPTSPVTIPAIMSSTNENICIQIESPPIMTNDNNTTQRRTSVESQLNNFVQDNIIHSLRISNLQPPSQDNQTSSTCTPIATSLTWNSNLQPPSQDNQTTSTCTPIATSLTSNSNLQPTSQDNQTTSICIPTIMSSRNQDIDIESSPVSQMNSHVLTDHTQTYLTRIFRGARCCNCTIL